jgi:hypothetical protein
MGSGTTLAGVKPVSSSRDPAVVEIGPVSGAASGNSRAPPTDLTLKGRDDHPGLLKLVGEGWVQSLGTCATGSTPVARKAIGYSSVGVEEPSATTS